MSRRRTAALVLAAAALVGCAPVDPVPLTAPGPTGTPTALGTPVPTAAPGSTLAVLLRLAVKGRAPRTGYAREAFGPRWADVDRNGCGTRDDVLHRDLTQVTTRAGTHGCVVLTGVLLDPYTHTTLRFSKERASEVQVDHVVALSNAWQTGAARWTAQQRTRFANDPLELLAVSGRTNQQKGDGDAATWLPPYRPFWCAYVARQVAVKARYGLWVTPPERDAMLRVLSRCPAEPLPR